MECVKDDMRIKGVSKEVTSERREWKSEPVKLNERENINKLVAGLCVYHVLVQTQKPIMSRRGLLHY
jgi:hypothetical protein